MKYRIIFLLFIPLLLPSCSTEAAEKVADEYHKKLKAGDYEYIVDNLIDSEQEAEDGRDAWLGLFELIGSWGEIKEIEKETGFHKEVNGSATVVTLDYKYTFEEFETYERLAIIDRGDGYKILGIFFERDKSKLDALTERG